MLLHAPVLSAVLLVLTTPLVLILICPVQHQNDLRALS
jgi:hypothetical protein